MEFLTVDSLSYLTNASLNILEKTGIIVKNEEARSILREAGCVIENSSVQFPSDLLQDCIQKAPSSFRIFDRDATDSILVGGNEAIFNPGSSAAFFKDNNNHVIRKARLQDMKNITQVVNHMKYLPAQSTAVIPFDVPEHVADLYRLYILLKFSTKPIITGAFTKNGFHAMRSMLEIVSGSSEELAKKPRAIFDCCPTSPLLWEETSCQHLLDCAKAGIPAEIVPAPIAGATSPVSLIGTLIQSNAEVLSGIALSQLVNPGAPIVYGCASSIMDMKLGIPRFGAIESFILACASNEIGRYYGLPTHAYLGTSDSKVEDSQAGFETGIGLAFAVLSNINIVSGPGMLAQLNCQSLEKLIIDNEICGSVLRLRQEMKRADVDAMVNLINDVGPSGNFLKNKDTAKRFRSEFFLPSDVLCRLNIESWKDDGSKDTVIRASEIVDQLLARDLEESLPTEESKMLDGILERAQTVH